MDERIEQERIIHHHDVERTSGLWWLAGLAGLIILVGVVAYAFGNGNPRTTSINIPSPQGGASVNSPVPDNTNTTPPAPDSSVTINENTNASLTEAAQITENAGAYVGENVTVVSDVSARLGDRAFLLNVPGISNPDLLVITNDESMVYEDDDVFGNNDWEVKGTVELLTLADIEEELDINLDDDLFADYEGMPYILADSVREMTQ